jgi:hypothetical protein
MHHVLPATSFALDPTGSTVLGMTRVVLPASRRWRRPWRFVSLPARIEHRAERSAHADHRTQCRLCGAAIMPDGTGHEADCWGLTS